jgi:hypothetical protein
MQLGRALIRLMVKGPVPSSGAPRRGYRRIEWIEHTLEPARAHFTTREFEGLLSALSVGTRFLHCGRHRTVCSTRIPARFPLSTAGREALI